MSDHVLTQTPPLVQPGWFGRQLARVLLSRVHYGRLTIVTPGGFPLSHGTDGGPQAVLVLKRWRTLRRLFLSGDIAFAESYLDGDWDSPDLPALIEFAGRNLNTLNEAMESTAFRRLLNRLRHRLNANTRDGSQRNIQRHYDLGNEFYRLWLDATMTYSSALFVSEDQTLEEAQVTKQSRVLELMALRGGESVLEIGIGWGGLAEKLVGAGCGVTGVTLSPSQLRLAQQKLGESAELRLQDYRDVPGTFDRIVSIEMIEAVGERYWPAFFTTLRDRLRPEGLAVVQAITIREDLFAGYRRCTDFIQHYIFPGGMLPTRTEIEQQSTAAGLVVRSIETFGTSYARTLAEWRQRFHDAWPEIERQGFDARFRRMWDYYLAYCEGGFRAGNIDVGLYVLVRP
jgi:cyclopropane-fatty-acyl-phospholipid synthase